VRRIISSLMASFGILICVVLAALAISGAGGYFAGERQRGQNATATTAAEIDLQYELSQDNMQAGDYPLAAKRLRWLVSVAPDYPGAKDALAQVEALLNQTATPPPTIAPSTGQSPEQLFAEAQDFYNAQQWANAIARLQEIQAADSTFRADEVKAMLYEALVTLGLQYLRSDRLQEGIVLMDRAAKIKPLDDAAAGERNLARLYQTGRTYEGLNWQIAINNYEAIYAIAPNYRDVKTRLLDAYLKFADYLTALGGHCDAAQLYQHAQDIKKNDEVQPKLDAATTACANPTPTPLGGVTVTPGGPTLTPLPTGTPTQAP
jgi:tetratricopeptide (TPR) repeat protein